MLLRTCSRSAKHAWRDAHWEEDLQKAYDAGTPSASRCSARPSLKIGTVFFVLFIYFLLLA